MSKLQFERDTEERRKWLNFAPPLINTLLGRDIFPQSTADTPLVESIAESLTEADIMKLASSLKPELWGPLAHRFHGALQKKQLEKQRTKNLLPPLDPEKDAAGETE